MFDPLMLILVCGIALTIHGLRGFRVPKKVPCEQPPETRVAGPTAIIVPREGNHASDPR